MVPEIDCLVEGPVHLWTRLAATLLRKLTIRFLDLSAPHSSGKNPAHFLIGCCAVHDTDEPFKAGVRFHLSVLGKERCPRLRETGVVIGPAGRSDAVRVLMDGRKTAMTLHISYIETR
jgi:hypothetical protein